MQDESLNYTVHLCSFLTGAMQRPESLPIPFVVHISYPRRPRCHLGGVESAGLVY